MYTWGNEFAPGGKLMANTWQGEFPWQNLLSDGYERTAPVGSFPPNGHGLYDMAGNVWEWTTDWYQERHPANSTRACCIPLNPRGGAREQSVDPAQPELSIPRKVLKGGSFLCSDQYCARYHVGSRGKGAADSSGANVGFRCIKPA